MAAVAPAAAAAATEIAPESREATPSSEPSAAEVAAVKAAAAALTLPKSVSNAPTDSFANKIKDVSASHKWNLVQERKKRKIVPVTGTAAPSTLEGVAPPKRRDFWEISVSRLAEGTTADKVKSYLHSKGVEVRETFVFPSKIKGTVAARVRVDLDHKEKALDPSIWPQHIRVQSWIQKRRTEKKDNATTAGVQPGSL